MKCYIADLSDVPENTNADELPELLANGNDRVECFIGSKEYILLKLLREGCDYCHSLVWWVPDDLQVGCAKFSIVPNKGMHLRFLMNTSSTQFTQEEVEQIINWYRKAIK
jgi:hypothetical protein